MAGCVCGNQTASRARGLRGCASWWLVQLAMALALLAPAQASASPETVVHLLDYIGVDYPQFVRAGKVLDEAEYKEQQEFSRQVIALLRASPDIARRGVLLESAAALAARIDAKASGDEVTRLATGLRWQVIEAYGLAVAPRQAPDLALGAKLYAAAQCASCHGAQGHGDGPAAKGLDPAPADFHDRDRMAQRSLYGLYNTITLGVAGTAMRAYRQLDEEARWALAFYVGTLGTDAQQAARGKAAWAHGQGKEAIGTLRALATKTPREVAHENGEDVAAAFAWLKGHPRELAAAEESRVAFSRRLIAQSLAAYRAGESETANRVALAAYLEGFELVEASLDAVDRNLRQQVELAMIDYRDLVRRKASTETVAAAAAQIDQLLLAVQGKLDAQGLSPTTDALSAFVILLREGLEALLVVAAIVALLLKAGRRDLLPWIHLGWAGALAAGALTWFVASAMIEVSGATRELTEGITALLAAAILLYVGVWLHGKRHAQVWQSFIDARLRGAMARGTLGARPSVSFHAVYREAFETVLFYQALWQQAGEGAHGSILLGFAGAVAGLALIAWLVLRYGVRLPLGRFFAVGALLLAALAVVFTGHGLRALQEAGTVPATPFGGIDVPALGVYPTMETLVAQVIVLGLLTAGFLMHREEPRP
jgi:high-affinity iron transporter